MGHDQAELSKMSSLIMILAAVVSISQSTKAFENKDNAGNILYTNPESQSTFNTIYDMFTPRNRTQLCWVETTKIIEINGEIISINREYSMVLDFSTARNDEEHFLNQPNSNQNNEDSTEEYYLFDKLKDEIDVRNFSVIYKSNGKIVRENKKLSCGSGFLAVKKYFEFFGNLERNIIEITISNDDFDDRIEATRRITAGIIKNHPIISVRRNISNLDFNKQTNVSDIVGAPQKTSFNFENKTEPKKTPLSFVTFNNEKLPIISQSKHIYNNYLLQLILRLRNADDVVQPPLLVLQKSREVDLPRAEVGRLLKNRELNRSLNNFLDELVDIKLNQEVSYGVNNKYQRMNRHFDRALEEKNPKDTVPSYEIENFKREYIFPSNYPNTGIYKIIRKNPVDEDTANRNSDINFGEDKNKRNFESFNSPITYRQNYLTRSKNGFYTNRRSPFGDISGQNGRSRGVVNNDRRTALNLMDDDGNIDDFGSYVPEPPYAQTDF